MRLRVSIPAHPSTSSLAASLPADWRSGGRCWFSSPRRSGTKTKKNPQRDFFMMASLLIDLFDASHFFWGPARLWSDAKKQFRASTAEMLASGMPPVLHLIAFQQHGAGVVEIIRTRGLAHFGQDGEMSDPTGWTVADLVRRLARLSLDIIINGQFQDARRLPGLDPGEWISMAPRESSKRFGRVWPRPLMAEAVV